MNSKLARGVVNSSEVGIVASDRVDLDEPVAGSELIRQFAGVSVAKSRNKCSSPEPRTVTI